MRIKKDDQVMVTAGKDKGKTGKVIQTFPSTGKVVVEGVNVLTKHMRARKRGEQGQKVQLSAPIDVSNVMIVDPKTKKPTRIKIVIGESGKKMRVAVKSGEQLS